MLKLAANLTLLLLLISSRSAAESAPGFALSFGGDGSGPGQFLTPQGLACDPQGNVYVADRLNYRIESFDGNGNFLAQWPISGGYPTAVAVDADGNVLVGQQGNDRISVFTPTGQLIRTWGTPGTAPGQFDYPGGIAINPAGEVFVSDLGNDRIQKFTSLGQFILAWGTEGSDPGQFQNVGGLDFGPGDNLYVMDSANDRVQVFGSDGVFKTSWGSGGTGDGQFTYAIGLTVDNLGDVYVADSDANRILKFNGSGTLLTSWGAFGVGPGYFDGPIDIATDASRNVFVSDAYHDIIQKFDPRIAPPPPRPNWPAKLMLHLTQPTSKNRCERGELADCAGAVVSGGLSTNTGPYHHAYLLVARGSISSIAALQCGISYEQGQPGALDNGQGIDVFSWTLCADLEFRTPAGVPAGTAAWPGSPSGNLMTWSAVSRCQFGETAVAGYFYLAAYSPDVLRIIPRPADKLAAVADCVPIAYALAPGDLGYAAFSANGAAAGCNPCLASCEAPTPVVPATWSRIKSLVR